MPTLALASAYWPGDGQQNGSPQATVVGYPAWQAAVTAGMTILMVLL